jgi:hypothetical protein
VTPFHHAHSTAVAGWKNISLGNDVFLNNVFAHPLGLSAYDSATEPVRMEGNAYLGGAAPSIHDRLPLRIEDFPVASIFVEAVAGQVFFHSDSPWQSESSACVDSDRLGKSAITGLPFEKPDGSPAVVDQDYFGKPRALAQAGPFVFGDRPTLADICLVPQLGNARRFKVDVSAYPRLLEAEAAALALPAFARAAPQNQPDFEA